MIRNQWYVVLESNEVGRQPVGVTRLGEKMVFWRDRAGVMRAAADRCPHRGVALSERGNSQRHALEVLPNLRSARIDLALVGRTSRPGTANPSVFR